LSVIVQVGGQKGKHKVVPAGVVAAGSDIKNGIAVVQQVT
jgi:hypothetical protein